MQGHRRTDEHVWLTEYVEPIHSEREEIELAQDMILEALLLDLEDARGDLIHFDVTLAVLQVLDDEIHEFMWTVHAVQFVKQVVMPQLIEGRGEINVHD